MPTAILPIFRTPEQPTNVGPIPRVSWEEHYDYLDRTWRPGQHCSIICPTGGGKSHLIRHGLLPIWRKSRLIAIDPTADDLNYGVPFRHVSRFPGKLQRQGVTPEWYRLTPSLDAEGREATRGVLQGVYREGAWVVDIDELRVITDPNAPCFGLKPEYENLMLRARKRRVTVIAATQAPRWVPSSFYDQPTHIYIGKILDEVARKRLREISGAETKEIVYVVAKLGRFEFLYVGPDERLEIVKAPRYTPVEVGR